MSTPLPALRPVEVAPFTHEDGEPYFALHDNSRIAPHPLAVSLAGYFVLAHLDGEHTVEQVQEAFVRQFRQRIPAGQIMELVAALDAALMLDNERSAGAYAERRDHYLAADVRDNRSRWPDEDALRSEIERMLAADDGGRDHGASSEGGGADGALAGIIAPHLDYGRGGPCYAAAYGALARAAPARRYVILGTNHFGRSSAAVATRKDFQTPLGRVETDRGFIATLEEKLNCGICAHEFDHEAEHSVELQVHVLQVLHGSAAFSIVPLLCPDPSGPSGTRPADGDGPDLGALADALGELLRADGVPTQVIAGADLSHVGQRFGELSPTTPDFLEGVAASDRDLLARLERREEQAFVERVRETRNATRICSVGCIYALLRALPGRSCRVLRYHQASDFAAETHVTCAAAVVG